MRRSIAATLSAFVLMEAILAPSAQASLWSDRARARPSPLTPTLFASLPAAVLPRLEPMPLSASVLPADAAALGSVRRVHEPSGRRSAGTVILVQDIHLNGEAQKNISALISSLSRDRKADLIALEGVFGPVTLNRFMNFKHPATIAAVSDFLLGEGRLSGAAHALLSSGSRTIGVDDTALYEANVAAYRSGARMADGQKAQLTASLSRVAGEKEIEFNAALKDFDRIVNGYRAGARPLSDYVRALSAGAATPQCSLFLRASDLEKQMNAAELESQRARLIETLTRKMSRTDSEGLLSDVVAFKVGRLSMPNFYAALERRCSAAGVRLSAFPQMEIYVRYLALADQLQADALFGELSRRERSVYASLAVTARERALVAEERRLTAEIHLIDFSMSSPEWDEYRSEAPLGGRLSVFEDFYRNADRRSAAMAANLTRAAHASGARTMVLVAGGFHTTGVGEALRRAGYTTVEWTPRVGQADPSRGSAYLTAFNQEKTPLEKIFEGRRLFVTPDPFAGLASFPALAVGVEEARDPDVKAANEQVVFDRFSGALAASVTSSDIRGGARVDIRTGGRSIDATVITAGTGDRTHIVSLESRWAPAPVRRWTLGLIPSIWGRLVPILMVRGWSDRQIAALGGTEEIIFSAVLVSGLTWLAGVTLGLDTATGLGISSLISFILFVTVHFGDVYQWREGFMVRGPPDGMAILQLSAFAFPLRALYMLLILVLPFGPFNILVALPVVAAIHASFNSLLSPLFDGVVAMAGIPTGPRRRDGQAISSPWITDPEVTLSHALPWDYPNIIHIRRDNLSPDLEPGWWGAPPQEDDFRRDFMEVVRGRRHGSVLVLKRREVVIGYALAHQISETTGALVESAVVDMERGHGLGRALFAERLRLMLNDLPDLKTITVSDGNPESITTRNAVRFGFAETGVRRLSLHLTPELRAALLRRLDHPDAPPAEDSSRDEAIVALHQFYTDRYLNASDEEMYEFPFLSDFRWTFGNDGADLGYFSPTPVVDAAVLLRAAGLVPGMIAVDAGGGDGRVAMTASALGATALSIEADPRLHEMALQMREMWPPQPGDGSLSLLNIPVENYDLSGADIVYYTFNEPRGEAADHDADELILGPGSNFRTMERQLAAQLKPGAVVVLTFSPAPFADPSLEPFEPQLPNLIHGPSLRPRFYRKRATAETSGRKTGFTDIARQHFPGRDSISFADLDTGSGAFVTNFRNALKTAFTNVDGVGIDTFRTYAAAKGNPILVGDPREPGEYEKAGLADASRDIVTINTIEPTLAVPSLIAQAARIVRPDGLIVITFERYDMGLGDAIDVRVRALLAEHGFVIEERPFPADYPRSDTFAQYDPMIMIARRRTAAEDEANAPGTVELKGRRRAIVAWEGNHISVLDAANPGLRAQVEHVVSTPFSGLHEGLDYDRPSGGRSAIIHLNHPRDVDGIQISAVKIKGSRFERSDSEFDILDLHRQHGAQIPMGLKVSKPTINKQGRFVEEKMPPIPVGGSRHEISKGELDATRAIRAAGFKTALPIADVRFPDDPAADGAESGAIVLGLEEDLPSTAEMITQVANETGMDMFHPGRATTLHQRSFIRFMAEMIVRQGRALRALNDAGFTHYQFHLDNSSIFADSVFYHDLEGATARASSTEPEFLGNALYGLRNALGAMNRLNSSGVYRSIGLNYVELFLDGYFHDLPPEERPVVNLRELDNFFVAAKVRPVTEINFPLARATARVLHVATTGEGAPPAMIPWVWNRVLAALRANGWSDRRVSWLGGLEELFFSLVVTAGGTALLSLAMDPVSAAVVSSTVSLALLVAAHAGKIFRWQDGRLVADRASARDLFSIAASGLAVRAVYLAAWFVLPLGIWSAAPALIVAVAAHSIYDAVVSPWLSERAKNASPEERLAASVVDGVAALEGASSDGFHLAVQRRVAGDIASALGGSPLLAGVDSLDGRASAFAGAVTGPLDENLYRAALERRFNERFGHLGDAEAHVKLWSAATAGGFTAPLPSALSDADPGLKNASLVIVTDAMRGDIPRLLASLPQNGPAIFVGETPDVTADLERLAARRGPVVNGAAAFTGSIAGKSLRVDLPALESVLSGSLGDAYLKSLSGLTVIAPGGVPMFGAGQAALFRAAVFVLIDEQLSAMTATRATLDAIESVARVVSSQA